MEPPRFVLSAVASDEADRVFEEHARRIRAVVPAAEVRHRGGSSVPGALTGGDVDVHVRTEPSSFAAARAALCELYEPIHRDMWHDGAAFFHAPGSEPPVELALTAIGSSDDFHHGEAWDRIASDPALLERYNALKREHEGGDPDAYRIAKRAFFLGLRDDQRE